LKALDFNCPATHNTLPTLQVQVQVDGGHRHKYCL